jgi:hypothetical protein
VSEVPLTSTRACFSTPSPGNPSGRSAGASVDALFEKALLHGAASQRERGREVLARYRVVPAAQLEFAPSRIIEWIPCQPVAVVDGVERFQAVLRSTQLRDGAISINVS